jgi:hypothetical protein
MCLVLLWLKNLVADQRISLTMRNTHHRLEGLSSDSAKTSHAASNCCGTARISRGIECKSYGSKPELFAVTKMLPHHTTDETVGSTKIMGDGSQAPLCNEGMVTITTER